MEGVLKNDRKMLLLAIIEITIMTLAVIFDLLLPSLILVFVGIAFCLIRKEKSLGGRSRTLRNLISASS
jgi:hypothetical protein